MAHQGEQLVGRAAELGSLDQALGELAQRRPSAVELVGEPGIGKTRLLAELGARADERGHTVLSGSASEFERDLPFWVFVDALDAFVAGLDPRALASLDDDARADLAHVLPALSDEAAPADAGVPQDERHRIHRAVRRLLESLAVKRPLVLLLDDLHWADAGSIELLAALLRRPPSAPVLTAFALRPRQVPDRLSGPLERAVRDGVLSTVELTALGADDARQLLGAAATTADADALIEQSGGNPFYLEQLARSADRGGVAATAGADGPAGSGGLPRTVAASLAAELSLLPDRSRRLLEGAAIAGDPFEPELAAAAAGITEPEAVEELDELFVRDLIRATDVPRRFRFRHPLVRRAVLEATPAGWRLGAHERSADALRARGTSAVARAHHVEHAGRHGDLAAIAVLREAGESVIHRSPGSAVRWFGAALRLLPDGAPVPDRVALLGGLAGAQAATGHFLAARTAMLECVELLPRDQPAGRVPLIAASAGLEHLVGRHDEAHARLRAAIEELPDTPSREGAELALEMAIDGVFRHEHEQMRDWAARALDQARAFGDRPLMAAAASNLALAHAFLCAIDEAEKACSVAAELVASMSDDGLLARPTAAGNLAAAEFYLDRFDDASFHGERALAVGRAAGRGAVFALLNPVVGNIRLIRGDLAGAAELFDAAVEMSRVQANDQMLAWNLVNRSLTATAAGDVDTALATAEEMATVPRALAEGLPAAWAGIALGAALLLGRRAGASRRHARGQRGRRRAAVDPRDLPGHRPGAADALPARGRPRRRGGARRGVRRVLRRDRRAGHRRRRWPTGPRPPSRWTPASTRPPPSARWRRRRRPKAAARSSRGRSRACSPLARWPKRGDAARRRRSSSGPRPPSRRAAPWPGATRPSASCAASVTAARPAGLDGTGTGDGAGIAALTEREREVARLIVDRRTNPQIAAALFLSPKTVETHVRNLFHKLGVSSRVDVARVVERAERDAAPR